MSARTACIVTGGAGFIGANLVGELLRREPGRRLLVVDDLRSGSFQTLVDACERLAGAPYPGDFIAAQTAELDWPKLIAEVRPGAVFHLASITDTTVADERTMIDDNLEGFRPILDACIAAGVSLMYASSAATYGSPPQGRDRVAFPLDAAGRPNNVYGFSKWMMENLHRRAMREADDRGEQPPRVVGLRYFNVFGPGEAIKGSMASLAFQLTNQILDGGRPRLFTDGEQARDQVDVMEVVECTIAAASPTARPGVYNCGSGRATTFNQLADAVRQGLGVSHDEAPTEYFDMPVDIRAFYQDYTCADVSETAVGLGWTSQRDPVRAIAAYAAHLASRGSR